MKPLSTSVKVYWSLIVVLAVFAAVSVYLPQGELAHEEMSQIEERPAGRPVLALANAAIMLVGYGGLGLIGLVLSRKLGFAEVWDTPVSNRERIFVPAVVGGGIGLFAIVTDVIAVQFHALGPLPHPRFPMSLVASITAGIGEEVVFRLFFVAFWVWLFSNVILKGRWRDQVFNIVVLLSAMAFTAAHLPSVMLIFGFDSIGCLPVAIVIQVVAINFAVSIPAAYYLRNKGLVAAVGVHFWADIVWHVLWGVL